MPSEESVFPKKAGTPAKTYFLKKEKQIAI